MRVIHQMADLACFVNARLMMAQIWTNKAALKAGAAFEKAGATASTHMWYGGIGIPNEMQGSVIIVRIFPSMEAWGQAFDRYFIGRLRKRKKTS